LLEKEDQFKLVGYLYEKKRGIFLFQQKSTARRIFPLLLQLPDVFVLIQDSTNWFGFGGGFRAGGFD
jgi:hypothetical protein